MTVDLTRAAQERGEVLRVERFGPIVEVTARLPHLARTVLPGQFAQLRCGGGVTPLLRRPFSIAWVEDDACSFVFEVVGAGTRLLGALRPGDGVDSLGPLGTGFSFDPAATAAVCVAGGLGCAPFPILCAALRQRGVADILVLNGAATAARLYPPERLQRGDAAIRVLEATDDGSRGHRGRVTELVAASLGASAALYACGPNPMLHALQAVLSGAADPPQRAEASLEAPMGCGFGTCLGCALPVHSGDGTRWALCCSDGPVMPMRDVAWDELMQLPAASVA